MTLKFTIKILSTVNPSIFKLEFPKYFTHEKVPYHAITHIIGYLNPKYQSYNHMIYL
jgi:hypothetical protein